MTMTTQDVLDKIEKIHEDGLKLLDSRKDIEYELVENCETNYLSEKLFVLEL